MKKKRKWPYAGIGLVAVAVLCLFLLQPKPVPEPEETAPTVPENRYGPEDFSMENGYLTCNAGPAVMGIDVSYYQGQIDWPAVKAAGVEFVMVRLGNRGTVTGELSEDVMARANLQDARAAGLQVGAYFYSQALTVQEAQEEAALALEILDGFPLDLPLTFDWEQETRTALLDKRTLTDCTLAFCQAVEQAGYEAMIYFNRNQANHLLELSELTEYRWWLAMYDIEASFAYRMDMWQYTCTGSVPGIEGNVDINLMFW